MTKYICIEIIEFHILCKHTLTCTQSPTKEFLQFVVVKYYWIMFIVNVMNNLRRTDLIHPPKSSWILIKKQLNAIVMPICGANGCHWIINSLIHQEQNKFMSLWLVLLMNESLNQIICSKTLIHSYKSMCYKLISLYKHIPSQNESQRTAPDREAQSTKRYWCAAY